ncbi:MAG: hypothetical protein CMJ83_10960 [Planctomycetes bacterium]|nr:hypothetical protein [Planctomycetota bacterium]
MSWVYLLQQLAHDTGEHEEANEWFYSVYIWLIAVVPMIVVILLAASKRKRKKELPHVTDMTWKLDIVESERPVLVHAYHKWSIGDHVIEAQVEKVGELCFGRLDVLWLDIEANPNAIDEYPTLGEKCVALFLGEKIAWQSQGVHDAGSIVQEIERFLPAEATSQ